MRCILIVNLIYCCQERVEMANRIISRQNVIRCKLCCAQRASMRRGGEEETDNKLQSFMKVYVFDKLAQGFDFAGYLEIVDCRMKEIWFDTYTPSRRIYSLCQVTLFLQQARH